LGHGDSVGPPAGLALLFFVENPLPDDWDAQRLVIGGLAS
jgi:hypothetical protein